MISDFLKLCLKSMYPAPSHKPDLKNHAESIPWPAFGTANQRSEVLLIAVMQQ